MSQIFVDKRGVLGVANEQAAPIQTKRVAYIVNSQDVANGGTRVPISWDIAFLDSNYTALVTAEIVTPGVLPNSIYVGSVSAKTASGLSVDLGLVTALLGSGGQSLVLHCVAIHD